MDASNKVELMRQALKRLCRDEQGATAIEYVLIASIAVIGVYVGANSLQNSINNKFNNIATNVSQAS